MIKKSSISDKKWHSIGEEDVYNILKTSANGIDTKEAKVRLANFGPNKLPDKHKISIWKIIFSQLFNPLIFILIAAAVASILIGEGEDAIFIFLVILINTIIGTYQEFNAEKSAASLQKLLRIRSKVKRNNTAQHLDSEELVPGDLVYLESGNKVPADLRLVETLGLEIDESFLTGESQAVIKNTDVIKKDTVVADRKNMAFAGSTVMSGRGMGIVVSTGLQTEVGKIAKNVSEGESAKPPLIHRMEKFTKNIAYIVIVLSVILAMLLRFQGMDMASIFFFVVALAVSAIPEGLPVSLTVALAVATKRMAKRNVIVRKLTSVESLGSCTVIASDKTGTLTVNQQTVKKIFFPDGLAFNISGEGYNGEGEILPENNSERLTSLDDYPELIKIIEVSILANEAGLEIKNGLWQHFGDAMDVALLGLGIKAGMSPLTIRNSIESLGKIPYESEKKYAAAFYKRGGSIHCGIKGAVETVLDYCKAPENSYYFKEKILQQANDLAEKGYRVLAFAEGEVADSLQSGSELENQIPILEFIGLICFIDPLRAEAKSAVEKCKKAGVKVIMITGDHPATAGNIARELGIHDENQTVVTGKMLSQAGNPDTEAYRESVASASVFARVSPQQKLEIVDVLIKAGEFVAVTGDGVNDAPALRRANLGVAMGSGTDVAKDVGAMIVVDDNFSSIVAGVEEGRFAYDNVRKVIYLLVSTGAAEVFMFIMAIIAGLPLPLLAVQLLWLNLVTNGIQDKALAFEAGEPETMRRKPRKPSEGIFNQIMSKQILVSGFIIGAMAFGYWYYLINYLKMEEQYARNLVLLLMVFLQNFHIFNCRSERKSTFRIPLVKNFWLIILVIAAQGVHIVSMHIPFMQELLRIHPITLSEWGIILTLALPIIFAMEIFKILYNKLKPQL
ncbi:cation-translocating P-type ATPase [Cecembia rubra]|uniref:P-type Cu(+) transporter n=1 Tax=Cecembia rubra TaxID=1485585 RepID=A0A2P8EA50_9BACT|nr:HAD-IC family P-type ATPase [Cecembia rubra]PSL06345.1 P-type E1-E2 ATPase [Cecembia rubra]